MLSLLAWEAANDVRVSRVSDREAAHSIVPSTGSAKLIVVTMEVVHTGLREHGIILNLTLAQSRAVVGNEDKLGLALAQGLQSRLESQAVLATLHHQLQASIDGICGLGSLGLLLGGHGGSRMRNLRKAPLKGLPATSLEAINYAGKQMQQPCNLVTWCLIHQSDGINDHKTVSVSSQGVFNSLISLSLSHAPHSLLSVCKRKNRT